MPGGTLENYGGGPPQSCASNQETLSEADPLPLIPLAPPTAKKRQ